MTPEQATHALELLDSGYAALLVAAVVAMLSLGFIVGRKLAP